MNDLVNMISQLAFTAASNTTVDIKISTKDPKKFPSLEEQINNKNENNDENKSNLTTEELLDRIDKILDSVKLILTTFRK